MKFLSAVALWVVVISAVAARAPAPSRRGPPRGPEHEPSNRGPEVRGPEVDHPEKIIFANETDEGVDDVMYTEEQLRWLQSPPDERSGMKFPSSRWPGAVIPYAMAPSLDPEQVSRVPEGLQMIQDATCVKFVQRTNEEDYVEVGNEKSGCSAKMGKIGGKQPLNLGGRCATGTIAHEMMHTLGIEHEQKRFDRDDYITIDWQVFDQMEKKWQYQYKKDDPNTRDTFGLDYDYESIMHYPSYSPQDTSKTLFYAKQPGKDKLMGQRSHLTQNDIALINAMYC